MGSCMSPGTDTVKADTLKVSYLVTGASSGIGLDLCKQLAARGDKVYATCRKRSSSASGQDQLSQVPGDVTIIEGIDVAQDDVGEKLTAALKGVTLDVIIHNAGSVNGTRDVPKDSVMSEQAYKKVSMDRMRAAFEVNTLGPLRVQKALTGCMKSPGGKVALISTGLGSIGDNGSGGNYAYRASKAAMNMVGKSMACDLKKDGKGIAVAVVAPGFVATEFGPGMEMMLKWGAKPVDQATKGIMQCIDDLTVETTGKYYCVSSSDGSLKEMEW